MNLAVSHRDGDGVPVDDASAARWFRASAEQDHAPACTEYGTALMLGRGVPAPDPQGAVRWYKKGAQAGDPIAKDFLKKCAAMGLDVS